ncbi:hypothetical protein L7F22_038799 [Adiantum nelumboides]|nr:hypothetical protein [Adiantum nelumboides]
MDVFQTLAGGGVHFDRKRFQSEIALFNGKAGNNTASSSKQVGAGKVLPKELDFFGDSSSNKISQAGSTDDASTRNGKQRASDSEIVIAEPLNKSTLPSFLKQNKIKQTGTDAPMPLTSWEELGSRWNMDKRLLSNLANVGWGKPTAVQMGAMPCMLDNRDTLVGAPTGSGKTLTYLLPILHHLKSPKKEGFRAVIVSPTKELAQQIYQQLDRLGTGKKWKFCVLTRTTEGAMRQDPQLGKNEADRLLEEGFLTQTDSILAACTHSSLRKALFSATMPAAIEELAKTFMYDEVRILVGVKDAAVESIEQELMFVSNEDGKLLGLRNLLKQGALKPPVLLFVQSIQRAQELFKELIYEDLHVDVIHSDRPKAQREGVIEAFKRGDVWVLICTEVLARGIDFKGVEVVVNYDFPQSRESYIHRIGRTGRAGRKGKAITFFTREDSTYLKSVVNVMRQSGCDVPKWMLDLKSPNQKQKKSLKRKAPERQDILTVAGSSQGRKEANRRRDMIQASKRRKDEGQESKKSNKKDKLEK